ncbi:MAG: hypothetical protein J6W54_14185 [Fibrobacter sp.]|uniref:hypothetical protein n=1 Tax=Fibrobacter sp. TaxID=35828 RepID=UPI001B1D59CD|nr:hypothetical protein [Fibrobacter sp.]MBO7062219.1 hypothetical protein [Fibrobacter sp.]
MLYKHWKKIVLALTGFFWASCDETSSSPVAVNEDAPSSSITETEGVSSSSKAKSTTSSAEETSAASSAERSSSSQAKSAASSAEGASAEETSASSSSKAMSAASSEAAASAESAASNAADPDSIASSSSIKSSSSSKKHHRSSSSVMDEPVDLYGCPSDICGPFIEDTISVADSVSIIAAKYGVIRPESSSSFSQIAAKYGVIRPESSSSISEIIAKYGVPSKTTCTVSNAKDGKVTYTCEDGVTCVEETKTEMQAPACNGDVCPKYGVVKISKKTYTCDNGQVYNEAEFQMLYDTLPVIEDVVIKDSIQAPIALYGPPCVFDGTCNKEK